MRRWRGALLATLLWMPAVQAAEPLPQPLTLDYALSLSDDEHPDLLISQHSAAQAAARLAAEDARDGLQVGLDARARWVEPPEQFRQLGRDDHRLRVYASKQLLDFGQSAALQDAARAQLQSRQNDLLDVRQQRRLQIMRSFFDVILADMLFERENEAMSIDYIRFDRAKDRHELGQLSDVDLLEAENVYLATRKRRYQAESRQRSTRARLAIALNRPDNLPSQLTPPSLQLDDKKRPELEALQQQLEADNPQLIAMRQQVQAAEFQMASARAQRWPTVRAEVEAAEYSRELGSSDQWRAGITLNVPLYDAGSIGADVARARADLRQMQARLENTRRELQQRLLEVWLQIGDLQAERSERQSAEAFRELYLDRARAIYELELKTDLGDAMVLQSQARMEAARNEFAMAMAWAEMDALLGKGLHK